MKKKIFITGASGFVGSHLVEAAQNLGLEVHAVVRSSSITDQIAPFVDKFVYPNLGDAQNLKTLFEEEQYHYIIHAAAMTKAKDEKQMNTVNVDYTEAIIEAATTAQIPLERVVYVSSLAAVGPIAFNSEKLIDESFPYRPVTVYGRSKRASELMIREKFADEPVSVFRPTAVYGPREKDIFILFDTMNKGLDPYIGRNPQKLSFIYVKDLCEVLLQGCMVKQDGLQFYNISDGLVYSRYAMADIFKSTLKKRLFRIHVPLALIRLVAQLSQRLYKNSSKTPVIYPERLGELTAENWGCNINHAVETLGFNPKYDLERGLTESLNWYKSHKWL